MFQISITHDASVLLSGLGSGTVDQIEDVITEAAAIWGRYIDAPDAVIDIHLSFLGLGGSTLAEAGQYHYLSGGITWIGMVEEELSGNADIDTAGVIDATLTIDLLSLLSDDFSYDSTYDPNETVPAGKFDLLTVMLHEFGHILGIASVPGVATFDDFIVLQDGQFYFTGANAVAANGGENVLLNIDQSHFGFEDLMDPSITTGQRGIITPVHVAIWKDLGLSVAEPSAAADTLYGFDSIGDTINGLAGDDSIFGLTGDDTLQGGLGNDAITGGLGADTFAWDGFDPGAAQTDTFTDFTVGTDLVDLGATGPASFEALQNHLLRESGGEAQLVGQFGSQMQTTTLAGIAMAALGASDFVFDTSATQRTVAGTTGNDTLFGGLGDDTLTGGDGADLLVGDAGDDTLNGDAGTDRFDGGAGADTFNGGTGLDRVDYNTSGGIVLLVDDTGIALAGSSPELLGDSFNSIEHVRGTTWADIITFSDADVVPIIWGDDGNDVLTGGAGTNEIFGGDGNDTINGGGADGSAMSADAGSRTLEVLLGGDGEDTINTQTLTGETSYAFGGNDADTLNGGAGNDHLFGDAGGDIIAAGAGNDVVYGGAGADQISATAGFNRFYDEDGLGSGDSYTGGSGFDTAHYSAVGAYDFSAVGVDDIDQTSVEWISFEMAAAAVDVTGTDQLDRFRGSASGDTLSGGQGNDWLDGQDGADQLDGGADNDRLDGGLGADTLTGGLGSDILTGGALGSTAGDGFADTFVFEDNWNHDRIFDFEDDLDVLDLTGVTGLNNVNQLTLTQSGADAFVYFDGNSIRVDNTTIAQLTDDILLSGV